MTCGGEAGNDVLYGDDGVDILYGGSGTDQMFGGAGNDVLQGDDGADLICGDEGDDIIRGGLGNDEVFGGSGDDSIEGDGNNDRIWGEEGDDTIRGGGASDEIHGGAGSDLIFGDVSEAGGEVEALETIYGDGGNDTIYANNFADVIYGGAGNDRIFALAGDDTVDAGIDDDEVFGGAGHDWIVGGFGSDALSGEAGSDVLWGGLALGEATLLDFDLANPENFELPPTWAEIEEQFPTGFAPPLITPTVLLGQNVEGRRGDGRDMLRGGEGTDFLFGGDEADVLLGGDAPDYLDAGAGDDVDVRGGPGNDVVRGASGQDALHGDDGIDVLYGDAGDDNLFGDAGIEVAGAQILVGQRLFGGAGRDSLFAYAPTNDTLAESTLQGEQLFGGSGGDFLFGNLREDLLVGESGNDFLSGDALRGPRYLDNTLADLDGGADELRGGSGEDQLLGGGGRDVLYGGADTDWLEGQEGRDTLYGGSGIDLLILDTGPTPGEVDPETGVRLYHESGDEFYGHFGNEFEGDVVDDHATDVLLIEGTAGDDVIRLRMSVAGEALLDQSGAPIDPALAQGGQLLVQYNAALFEAVWLDDEGQPRIEQVRVSGLLGNDDIAFVEGPGALNLSTLTSRGRDFVAVIDGGPGNDTLSGTPGRDRLDGGNGSDTLFGLAGDDRLYGDGGQGFATDHDVLYAGQGNDDLIGGQGTNELFAWSRDPRLGGEFGVFVDPETGALFDESGGGTRAPEDTGLDRMLGSAGDDALYGGTGVDFMYGNGGNDTLYRADGSSFESLDEGLAGDAWKEYAKGTGRVWYVGATNADDVIALDFVTEVGLLQDHHLLTRLTEVEGSFSFSAQVRLDFSATDDQGNLIWDPNDVVLDIAALQTDNLFDRNEALAALAERETALVNGLLPPEGDFVAILIDALSGDDRITIGPTVQKTVWVDAGPGDDFVEILAGNAILVDRAEYGTRNDLPGDAFRLGGPARLRAGQSGPADGRLTRRATFELSLGLAAPVEVVLTAGATLDNANLADLKADLNEALAAADLAMSVRTELEGDRLVLVTLAVGTEVVLVLTAAPDDPAVTELGFAALSVVTGKTLTGTVGFQNLTLDGPEDVDYFRFELGAVPGADAAITASSLSERDGLTLTLRAPDLTPLAASSDGRISLAGRAPVEYLLEVRSNRVPTRYTLVFDVDDGAGLATLDLGVRSDFVRRDVLLGGEGDDVLSGGAGEDWIFGGPGNDVLTGGADRQASDLVFGGEGDDLLQLVPDALPFSDRHRADLHSHPER